VQGRDLDGNNLTAEAYYDTVLVLVVDHSLALAAATLPG
jgi:hypothetical protein